MDLERMAQMVLELDRLARDLPLVLGKLRSVEANTLARGLSAQSQALRLGVVMELPPSALLLDAQALEAAYRRLDRLSLGSRMPGTGRAALVLGTSLAAQLIAELSD
ncbi:hypothetical protein ACQ859_10855 [Roseateles chitinivorans]|uniref:hypothetical protein n=1 Tax=Roseateles chitinivorans TaxID=2917965 RepID=UPI003D66DEFF